MSHTKFVEWTNSGSDSHTALAPIQASRGLYETKTPGTTAVQPRVSSQYVRVLQNIDLHPNPSSNLRSHRT